MLAWGGFCLCRKTVNAQSGRWKQLCRINCDWANIYQLLSSRKSKSRSCFAIFPDTSPVLENMDDNNNKVCWNMLIPLSWVREICFQFSLLFFSDGLFSVCNLYFFLCLLHSSVMVPTPPPSDQSSTLHLVIHFKPLDGNASKLHFPFGNILKVL